MAQIFTLWEPPEGSPWYFVLFHILLFLFALLLPFLIRYVILRRPVINLWSAIPLALICSIIIGPSLRGLFMAEYELSDFDRLVLYDPEFLEFVEKTDPKTRIDLGWTPHEIAAHKRSLEEKLKQRRAFIIPIFVAALVYAYCIMHVGYRDYCIKRLIADETDEKPEDKQKQ